MGLLKKGTITSVLSYPRKGRFIYYFYFLAWSLSYKTFLADIVVIYEVILMLEKSASIAIVMYEKKVELLSKQKKS